MLLVIQNYIGYLEKSLVSIREKGYLTENEMEEFSTSVAVLTASLDYWLAMKDLIEFYGIRKLSDSVFGKTLAMYGKEWFENPNRTQNKADRLHFKLKHLKARVRESQFRSYPRKPGKVSLHIARRIPFV